MVNNRLQPKPGQESVWDYPRPPIVKPVDKSIQVVFNGVIIAESSNAKRVLETSHPPVYYIPQEDIQMDLLSQANHSSFCEWKGQAIYYSLEVDGEKASRVAWSYPDPNRGFESIKNHLAFFAQPMDSCTVGGEQVTPQPGGFYGGWITKDITGPFKGGSGTMGW
jgi:uncharacterized protein (DUF427 family)